MARENLIWNTAIASLQFWTEDLDPVTLGIATEEVYSTFFYSTSTYTLHQQPDEILFGCFLTTLNAAFEQQLALADKGYESGSDTINLHTPLRKMPRIHHVSSTKNASFNPDPVMPWSTFQTPPRPVCKWLLFSSSNDSDTSEDAPSTPRTTPAGTQVCLEEDEEEEEDFFGWQTLDYWGSAWLNIVYTWTCLTTWAMPLSMSLCG